MHGAASGCRMPLTTACMHKRLAPSCRQSVEGADAGAADFGSGLMGVRLAGSDDHGIKYACTDGWQQTINCDAFGEHAKAPFCIAAVPQHTSGRATSAAIGTSSLLSWQASRLHQAARSGFLAALQGSWTQTRCWTAAQRSRRALLAGASAPTPWWQTGEQTQQAPETADRTTQLFQLLV